MDVALSFSGDMKRQLLKREINEPNKPEAPNPADSANRQSLARGPFWWMGKHVWSVNNQPAVRLAITAFAALPLLFC